MPAMIRPKGKAKKIAYSLLGVPDSMKYKKTTAQKKRDERLNALYGQYYR